jgi:AAA+ ATPase superfamily predicted ATPase
MAGIVRSNIVKYLGVLRQLGYVERIVPATVRHPEQSRQGRYVIVDPYLRFYFRFLAPNLGFIERGMVKQTINLLHDHLPDFIGTHTFEELCREWVAVQGDRGLLPLLPERIGSFWSKQAQVDVVAINWRTKSILLGECKWGKDEVGRSVIRTLIDKTAKILPTNDPWTLHYVFFARQGFTAAAQSAGAAHQAQLVTLPEIEADIQQWMEGQR